MHIDLSNKIVLVTGASRGIGSAIASGMAEAGASVAVHYNRNRESAEVLAHQMEHNARIFQADLADTVACEQLFKDVLSAFGRVDVLVNNAGLALPILMDDPTPLWQRAWDITMAVNLRAVELLCRLAIAQFRKQGGGRIINIASRAAFRGDTPEYMAYAASKGGVIALTRSIARGFGKEGIRAFAIAPGFTRTDMAQDFIDQYGESLVLNDIALENLTEPEDIAPTIVLLASGLADHATGTTIDFNAASYVR